MSGPETNLAQRYEAFQATVTEDYRGWLIGQECDAFARLVNNIYPTWDPDLSEEDAGRLMGPRAAEQLAGKILMGEFRSRIELVMRRAIWDAHTGTAFLGGDELDEAMEAESTSP